MPDITFNTPHGPGYERTFTKADFSRNDIDHGVVKFNEGNGFTADVTDEVFEFLKAQGEAVVLAEPATDKEEEVATDAAASAEAEAANDGPVGTTDAPAPRAPRRRT